MGAQGLSRCSEMIPSKTLNISTQVCHVLQKCVVPESTSQSSVKVVNTHTLAQCGLVSNILVYSVIL